MWHSTHSTGIQDVDDQHKAIDNLIELYRNARNVAEEQQCLDVLQYAVQSHFQFVEHFFDVKFPTEFKQRQGAILGWLANRIQERKNGVVAQEEFADELSRMFLLNVTTQGTQLKHLN